ncbi:hypothetical protein BKK51_10335 [Rodentibacter trehalosifermentans]|uniref:Uncharacterized protein n=1 Tax=Rodentibacter trehalosifermentans TaxID=1908263 RepID=A0A1V3IP85_9PAST|nr:hypothetical protein [Rodentibacter trehalosifermentans]OOF43931.1 hypothetical protein BKK51_10335 [Rodentibacter trehalosifermentans]
MVAITAESSKKKVRLNFEVSELRKKQIKTYTSLRGISIKDFFDEFLNSKFGVEQEATLENNETLTAMQPLTPEEEQFFNNEEKYWENHPQSKRMMSMAELKSVAQQVINGGELSKLLGMENMIEYD